MKPCVLLVLVVVSLPTTAIAHVSVRPRESKPDAEEHYTVRVPTEGSVATTHIQLEIPPGVTVLEVLPADGASFEVVKVGDRVTSITWRKAIAPKQAAEFVFRARNPSAGPLVWKAHQHFSDGTVADWIGPGGAPRPAAVTTLASAGLPAPDSSVGLFHLFHYLDEHTFRVNTPSGNDTTRFPLAIKGILNRRPGDAALSGSELPQPC